MARTLYERGPVADDRRGRSPTIEAAAQARYPVTPDDFVAWFARHYPRVKATTVKLHVKGLTANDPSRYHFHSLVKREPLFTKNSDGSLSPFEGPAVDEIEMCEVESDAKDAGAPRLEFTLEASLKSFCSAIGKASTGAARNALVVIELKRGRPSDRVVGKAARYVGWVAAHLARENQPVEGLIVAHEQDLQLAYAVSALPNLSVLTYNVDFRLSAPERPEERKTRLDSVIG